MTSSEPKLDHLERTAAEPRDKEVNDTTRIFHLAIPQGSPPIRFLPGQWLDVYVPGVEKAGGFTITSAPREARLPHAAPSPADESESPPQDNKTQGKAQGPYLELAVQKSPDNPPAAWLWRDPPTSILGEELRIRVGGGFVWPPPGINVRALRRVVFVAGGVGVNPLVAMLSSIASTTPNSAVAGGGGGGNLEVHFLYSLKDPGASGNHRDAKHMLFLDRIAAIFREKRVKGSLQVFLTSGDGTTTTAVEDGVEATAKAAGDGEVDQARERATIAHEGGDLPFHARRCTVDDVAAAVGTAAERRFAVVYVCGVPTMTDEFVAKLTDREKGVGMEPHRVLCEKWW
ncbi:hypothetical protein HD806DRAFT_526534 [Xylariaceae sp. AK1471]|nr:hypothetical protein HD806DRAFT_526534 [Xylariaceae sp. AK1471]